MFKKSSYLSHMQDNFTFADLCAGIGGFHLPLSQLGGKCLYSSDLEIECEKTYSANYNRTFDEYDVHNIPAREFPHVDILCAGFPCQPFSIAGKRKGFLDYRSTVFYKLIELAEVSQPKVLFFENVPNMVTLHKGEVFKEMVKRIREIGYIVYYNALDSADFGVPQARKRVYIVAFHKSFPSFGFQFTKKRTRRLPFRLFVNSGDNSIPVSKKWETYIDLYTNKISEDEVPFKLPKTRKQLERADRGVDLSDCVFQIRSSGIRAVSIDKPLPTLAVSISGGGAMIPVYSKERRHISLIEMKRMMGFPDDFHFPVSRTNSIKQLANAVCPPVIKSIGSDIIRVLQNEASMSSFLVEEPSIR